MRLPILEIARSSGAGALGAYRLSKTETLLSTEMEKAVALLPRQAPLSECHRVVAGVGARHGLGKMQSVALWTRATMRLFEPGASDLEPAEVGTRLEKLVEFTFNHAAPSIQSSGGVAPFLVAIGSGPPALVEFPSSLQSYSRSDARDALAKLSATVTAYAIALVGAVNPRSVSRTLFVEAAERRQPAGHLFARDFKPLGPLGPFEFAGAWERVGDAANHMLDGA